MLNIESFLKLLGLTQDVTKESYSDILLCCHGSTILEVAFLILNFIFQCHC